VKLFTRQLRNILCVAIFVVASLGAGSAHALAISSAGASGNWNAVATWAIVTAGIPGTISSSTASTTVTGTGTSFTQLRAGDQLLTTGNVLIGTILTTPVSDTSLTLTANAAVNLTNQAYRIRKVPNTNDTVTIINAAHTIQVTANASTTTVSFTQGASNTTLQVNTGFQLTITGLTVNSSTNNIVKRVDLQTNSTLTVNGNVSLVVGGGNASTFAEIRLGSGASTLVDISGDLTANSVQESIRFSGNGTLRVGGAFSAGGLLTVGTGTVDFDGTAVQAIPAYTYNNLTVSNTTSPASATVAANIAVNGNLTVNANAVLQPAAGTIISGTGTLTGNGTVRVTRTAATPGFLNQYTITNRTLTNLTVEYFAGAAQTMSGTTYGNVIVNHTAAATTVAGTATVNGTLTLTAGTLAVAGNTLALNGPTTAGTPANLTTTNASTLSFGGSSMGVNVPSSVAQLLNLTVNNTNGITLNSSPTINGALTFTQGNIAAGANTVVIPAAGAVSRTSGHVIGNLQRAFSGAALTRTFDVGDVNAYAPVTLQFASVTVAGSVIAKTVSGSHPDAAGAGIESLEDVNRYWTMTQSGGTFGNYTATFNYAQGGYSADVDSGAVPGVTTFLAGKTSTADCNSGCTWSFPTLTSSNGTQTVISPVSTGFGSDFAIGNRKIANFLVEAFGGGSIPGQTQNVSFNIRITARNALGNTVTSFTGTVDVTSGCTLSAGGGSTAAFAGGVLASHSVTLSSIGSCSITATRSSGGSQTGTSNTFTVATEAIAFNGCENTSPQCTVGGLNYDRLFTKLAGTGFNIDLIALKSGGTLATGFASTAAVDLLANSTPQGVGADNCPASQTAIIALGNQTFAGGRKTVTVANNAFSSVAPNFSAYRDVRVRVSCDAANCPPSGLTFCSADNFSVRPTNLVLSTAVLTNTAQTGTPSAAAGSDFTLTSTAVPGYAGAPVINRTVSKIYTHVGVGDFTTRLRDSGGGNTITFPAAAIGTGVSSKTVQYHDVGNVGVLAGGIVDSGFTVDDPSKGECDPSTSSNSDNDANANNGLVYGCNIANQSNSSLFGRFYPGSYALGSPTATAACAADGFSYMGHAAMGLGYTLSAMSLGNPTAGDSLKLTKYTSGYATLATVSVLAQDGATAVDLSANFSPSLAYNPSTWSAGDYAVTGSSYAFARPASTPSGPYDTLFIGAGVTDADGAALTGLDFKLGDPTCTVACTHKKLSASATKVRFGRLRLLGAVGSESLNLPIPMRTEYWTGTGFQTNTLDNCTALAPTPPKKFVLFGHQGGITTGNMVTPTAGTDGNVDTSGTFVNGVGSLKLLTPSPAATTPGSVRVCLDLDVGAAGDTSCQAVSPANLTHLQGKWSGSNYDKDPSARAAFGLYGSQPRQFIFFRESY